MRRALPQVVEALKSGRPAVQRAAAEALGRIGDPRAVPDLLAAAAAQLDRTLEHSVTYALIEIADPSSTAAGLQAASLAGETRGAHRARSDGRRRAETRHRSSPCWTRPDPRDEGHRLVDRRPSPGMGRRDGGVLPAAPDRSKSQRRRRATTCSRSSSCSERAPRFRDCSPQPSSARPHPKSA